MMSDFLSHAVPLRLLRRLSFSVQAEEVGARDSLWHWE
jgi:hypothetical protein